MKEVVTLGINTMKQVTFTAESAKRLKELLDTAVANGADAFTFDGNDYYVEYAKHVLALLKTKGLLK